MTTTKYKAPNAEVRAAVRLARHQREALQLALSVSIQADVDSEPTDPVAQAILSHVRSVSTAICAALAQDDAFRKFSRLLAASEGWEEA